MRMLPARYRLRLREFLLLVMLASLVAASFAIRAEDGRPGGRPRLCRHARRPGRVDAEYVAEGSSWRGGGWRWRRRYPRIGPPGVTCG